MKKIVYSIENRIVFMNLYDTELDLIVNFRGIYHGDTKKDCETWLKKYKAKKEGKKCTK